MIEAGGWEPETQMIALKILPGAGKKWDVGCELLSAEDRKSIPCTHAFDCNLGLGLGG